MTVAFDASAFAAELHAAMAECEPPMVARQLALALEISPATVSRVLRPGGWPDVSHRNWLALNGWLQRQARKRRRVA